MPSSEPKVTYTDEPSPRELELLHLYASGLNRKEIADQLHLSIHTVASHMAHLKGKLMAKTIAHAVSIGYCKGYLTTQERMVA